MEIKTPYLLFIGNAQDPLSIKLAKGIADWRPELAVGEFATEGCTVTTNLRRISIKQAASLGAKTFVLGFANSGGTIDHSWIPSILSAMENGMDIASGLHQRLDSIPQIVAHSKRYKRNLIDVRHPTNTFKTGTGEPRTGKRLLTVGTDCSVGKMYTALSLEQEMKRQQLNVSFKATGQSGIFIAGQGIAIDCVISDFIAGAVEQLSPNHEQNHWDIIEGQGSLFHPAFAGVSMGLIHGAQPDALVLCHAEGREHMRGIPNRALPSIQETIELNIRTAHLTNRHAKFIGISLNTSSLSQQKATDLCKQYEDQFQLPCIDPVRFNSKPIVSQLL